MNRIKIPGYKIEKTATTILFLLQFIPDYQRHKFLVFEIKNLNTILTNLKRCRHLQALLCGHNGVAI